MKKRIIYSFLVLFVLSYFSLMSKTFRLGIFDTAHTEQYRYDPFINICKSVDFDVDYVSIAQIADTKNTDQFLKNYDGILFVLDIEFLKGMANSIISHKILNLIENFSKESNKLIGLALPTIAGRILNKARLFAPIFKRIGFNVGYQSFEFLDISEDSGEFDFDNEKINKNLEELFWVTNQFLDVPLEGRSFLFHTTLNCPRKIDFLSYASKRDSYFAVLPIKNSLPFVLAPTLPYGIYSYNPIRKNHIFLTSSTLLHFTGISESFHCCPVDFGLRKKMYELIQEMMWELRMILNQKSNDKLDILDIEENKKPDLPKNLTYQQKKVKGLNKLKKIAWMEIHSFEKDDNKSKIQQDLLVDCILKSGSDLYLWITLNPHMYYSPIAKNLIKKETFWKSVALFTKKLKCRSKFLKIKAPQILVGYEITNNIYEPNLPKQCAIDLYGNTYFDIPSPLDDNFWYNEIKHPLTLFLKKWKNPKINNGIKIAGVVLDLEMYCRRTTGTFLGAMGFEPKNIEKFCKLNSLKCFNTDKTEEGIDFLLSKSLLQKYFDFLEEQSFSLGNNLKKFFYNQLPNCKIACYAPNISVDWFYKGFYKGLSEAKKPIQLLTFNAEFNSHRPWLEKNGINVNHSCVLMLSKLNNQKDFSLVDNILQHHDGIWLNRFSRFAEDQSGDWTSIERSNMSKEDDIKFFEYIRNK